MLSIEFKLTDLSTTEYICLSIPFANRRQLRCVSTAQNQSKLHWNTTKSSTKWRYWMTPTIVTCVNCGWTRWRNMFEGSHLQRPPSTSSRLNTNGHLQSYLRRPPSTSSRRITNILNSRTYCIPGLNTDLETVQCICKCCWKLRKLCPTAVKWTCYNDQNYDMMDLTSEIMLMYLMQEKHC